MVPPISGGNGISPAVRTLAALAAGLAVGAALAAAQAPLTDETVAVARVVGGLWLDALRMTIIPLVFALLVNGIVAAASAASAGRVAGRSMGLFAILLVAASGLGVALGAALLWIWPIPPEAAAALRSSATGLGGAIPTAPEGSAFWQNIIPKNPIKAAAEGAILPLVIFALAFGFALTRIEGERRAGLAAMFSTLAETMLVIVGWVLWLAPLGVFALALVVSANTGLSAAAALAHYVVFISLVGLGAGLLGYPLAAIGGRIPLLRFLRAAGPAQAVAASTQSSLASLPAMLVSARRLELPDAVSGVTLPMAVSLFRITNPMMNIAIAVYAAGIYGIELGPTQIIAGMVMATAGNFSAVGVSSQVNFFTTVAPVLLAMGIPIELLALLIAVETIPDIFRTTSNVTMDLAVTTVVARASREPEAPAALDPAPARTG